MTTIIPTEKEIDTLLNDCKDAEDLGETRFPGMTYEQGVYAGIEWLRGNEPHPLDDE